MAERRIGVDEDGWHMFFLCVGCLVSCSSGLGKRVFVALVDCSCDAAPRVKSYVSRVKAQGVAFIGCTWQWLC
jgi:hypothetical protein